MKKFIFAVAVCLVLRWVGTTQAKDNDCEIPEITRALSSDNLVSVRVDFIWR